MALESTTTSNITKTKKSEDGFQVGQSATDKVGFYGTTPIVQPSGAAQAAITDTSGGTAASDTGLQALTGSYNSTLIANALSTLAAQGNAMQAALANLGLIAGE